jgi:hypothetical protein
MQRLALVAIALTNVNAHQYTLTLKAVHLSF